MLIFIKNECNNKYCFGLCNAIARQNDRVNEKIQRYGQEKSHKNKGKKWRLKLGQNNNLKTKQNRTGIKNVIVKSNEKKKTTNSKVYRKKTAPKKTKFKRS